MVGNLGGRLLGLSFHHQNPGDYLVAGFLAVLTGRKNVSLGDYRAPFVMGIFRKLRNAGRVILEMVNFYCVLVHVWQTNQN